MALRTTASRPSRPGHLNCTTAAGPPGPVRTTEVRAIP